MLKPKQITHTKRIKPPKLPNKILNASAVNVTPWDDDVSQTPDTRIIKAVAVHIINVSKIKKRKGTDIKPPPIPNNPAQKPTGIAAIIIKRMKKI